MNTTDDTIAAVSDLATLVTDKISAMIGYWDKDLKCRFANAAYLQWFGMTKEEMVNKITIDELLGPLYQMNLPYIRKALEGEPQTFEREIPIPGGGSRFSLANYYPHIENNEVKGFFVHVADVTPMKELEQQLLKKNDVINDRNRRLLNFANIVSHNLKSYSGNLGSLLSLLAEADEEMKPVIMQHLFSLAESFSKTVDHLNVVSKAHNQTDIHSELIDIHQLIQRVSNVLRLQVNDNAVNLQNQIPGGTAVYANPAYMESIFLNLLTNAIKYRHPGRTCEITLSSKTENNLLYMYIKDNGLGIDLDLYGDRLFGMYQTFHGNKDAEGVGLFITRFHAEAMKGSIMVESTPGEGSSFCLVMPERGEG